MVLGNKLVINPKWNSVSHLSFIKKYCCFLLVIVVFYVIIVFKPDHSNGGGLIIIQQKNPNSAKPNKDQHGEIFKEV